MLAEEFREDAIPRSDPEKIREARAEGVRHDELGRRPRGVHRAEPTAEELPDGRAAGEGEVLQEALGNAAELHVAVLRRELATHLLAVPFGAVMHELVAAGAA